MYARVWIPDVVTPRLCRSVAWHSARATARVGLSKTGASVDTPVCRRGVMRLELWHAAGASTAMTKRAKHYQSDSLFIHLHLHSSLSPRIHFLDVANSITVHWHRSGQATAATALIDHATGVTEAPTRGTCKSANRVMIRPDGRWARCCSWPRGRC